VAESFGLGDFGDVVFDEPGFVGVAQVVVMHAAQDRFVAVARVSVDGGLPQKTTAAPRGQPLT
jgi:hypothetical protein